MAEQPWGTKVCLTQKNLLTLNLFLTTLSQILHRKHYQRAYEGKMSSLAQLQRSLQIEIMGLWLSNPGGSTFVWLIKILFSRRMSIWHSEKISDIVFLICRDHRSWATVLSSFCIYTPFGCAFCVKLDWEWSKNFNVRKFFLSVLWTFWGWKTILHG